MPVRAEARDSFSVGQDDACATAKVIATDQQPSLAGPDGQQEVAETHAVVVGDGKKFISALLVPKEDIKIDIELISAGISKANEKAANNVAKVKKWTLLDKTIFSVEGGELSPTLKLKRSFIHEKYRETIDKMYEFIDA